MIKKNILINNLYLVNKDKNLKKIQNKKNKNKKISIDFNIYNLCLENTMVSREHLNYLSKLVNKINIENISGSIVECGVWKGGSIMFCINQQKLHNMDRDFYLFDTFDGLTEPCEKDGEDVIKAFREISNNNKSDKVKFKSDLWHNENKWCYASLEIVKHNVSKIDYDSKKINFIKGDVCKTLLDQKNIPNKISILRLDTDFYESTKTELEVLFPKVCINGIIIVDDYNTWQGSRKATDEFLESNKGKYEILNIDDEQSKEGILVFKKISN